MPVGEDIPILIPISIIIVVVMLFLLSLFVHFSEQSDIIRMSQTSLDIGDYIINVKFAYENGTNEITFPDESCRDIKKLNMSSNYKTKVSITNLETGESWDCGNLYGAKDIVINNIPTLMIENNKTVPAMVKVSVGK